MHLVKDDATIRDILAQVRRMAIVGLSDKPERPSHIVASHMIEAGYDIVPVNPHLSRVLGKRAVPDLYSVSAGVSLAVVFRRAEHIPDIVEACIEKNIHNLWLQEGVIHLQAALYAAQHNIRVVMDRCVYKEYQRLLA